MMLLKKGCAGHAATTPRLPCSPFQQATRPQRGLQRAAGGGSALGGATTSTTPAQQLLSLLAPALDLLASRPQSSPDEQLCRLSYADGSSASRSPMRDTVRAAFAALEDSDDDAEGNTLCLVTYSEEDGVQALSPDVDARGSGRSAVLAFAQLDESRAAAALVTPGGMMDTLCLLSYDEDA